ncbi:MAG: ParA family protein [Bacteroidetes bacterium]|nr:ParA family protein [Bacteroidota bacterium]
MITIAVYNLKGGVGKTAAAVNLAWLSANEGRRTLLWDLDSQGSASFYFHSKPKYKIPPKKVAQEYGLTGFLKKTDFGNLTILPADFANPRIDAIAQQMHKSPQAIRKALKEVSGETDLVWIDAPGGFTPLTANLLAAADWILVPLIPTVLSLRSYSNVVRYVRQRKLETRRIIPFFSLVDLRKSIHSATIKEFVFPGSKFTRAYIPYASDVERMGVRRAPLVSYSRSSTSAMAYTALWKEIVRRTKLK